MARRLHPIALSADGFAAFGDVVEFAGRNSYPINQGMADRYPALAAVDVVGDEAHAVISLVASRKYELPHRIDHLEAHPLGSQAFIPFDTTPFVIVVGEAAERPEIERLQAFISNGRQGINYHRGTWHHVLLTPYAAMRFICVDREGAGDNCIDFNLAEADQAWLELPVVD